ncbi:hypothetical protein ACTXT7_000199 [Hymenolepis weldensis]
MPDIVQRVEHLEMITHSRYALNGYLLIQLSNQNLAKICNSGIFPSPLSALCPITLVTKVA